MAPAGKSRVRIQAKGKEKHDLDERKKARHSFSLKPCDQCVRACVCPRQLPRQVTNHIASSSY